MKYCFNCNRTTAATPLFCNHCGATYDLKLCPRLHPNPRWAEVCSQCGSRDLSTPQPKVPLWAKVLLRVTPIAFGALVAIISVFFLVDLLQPFARHPDLLFALTIVLSLLWSLWSEVPNFTRRFIYQSIKRRERYEKH